MTIAPVSAEIVTVDGGTIDISADGTVTNWNVSGNPVWNVPEFNVAAGSTYNITGISDNSSLALLVGGGSATNIFGTMNLSNLDFILQNIYGINIGATGLVNVRDASFIATTLPLNLNASNFLTHQYLFEGEQGLITNDGRIQGHDAARVALVANAIDNKGAIDVPMGHVALAAGDVVTIGISGDGMVSIGVDEATANELGLKDQIRNSGSITADGGKISLTAKAIDGLFEKAINIERSDKAVEAIRADNGSIEFLTLDDVYVNAIVRARDGSFSVGTAKGGFLNAGTLDVKGGKLSLDAFDDIVNEAIITASNGLALFDSQTGGFRNTGLLEAEKGKIEIAASEDILNEAIIKASNGEIFLDSETGDVTNAGVLEAEQGSIEIRTEGIIENRGTLLADRFYEHGYTFRTTGILGAGNGYFDNTDLAADIGGNIGAGTYNDVNFNVTSDLTLLGNVVWNASGAFTMASDRSLAGGGYNLTITAASASSLGSISNVGIFTLGGGATFTASPTATTWTGITDFRINSDAKLNRFTGAGTGGDPYMIYDVYGLQAMKGFLSSAFQLNDNIDASGTTNWNSGAGFDPVGNYDGEHPEYAFTGSLNGSTKTVTGLTINRPGEENVGLFGYVSGAVIRNIGLLSSRVRGGAVTGGLVGNSNGPTIISGSYNQGAVTGSNGVGGLVGHAGGGTSISNSYSTGTVGGSDGVGGLLGAGSDFNIVNSYSEAAVRSDASDVGTGGLVGRAWWNAAVTNSHATGNVTLTDRYGSRAGGLIGWAAQKVAISNSYATGSVTAGSVSYYLGGLVGGTFENITITNSYATGSVNGYRDLGGLVGFLTGASSIDRSYATGNVTGKNNTGGLVGRLGNDYDTSSITNSYSTGVATSSSDTPGGLVGYQPRYTGSLTNNWWYNETNTVGVGSGSSPGVTKAAALSDFYGTGSGTGGGVYTGGSPWDFAADWSSRVGDTPRLRPASSTHAVAGFLSGFDAGISMALSLDGAAPVTTTTTAGGAFSFDSVTLNGGEYLLIYVNDGSYQSGLVGIVRSASDIAGLAMHDGRFAIGDADGVVGTNFTNSTLSGAYYSNPNVHYALNGWDLTLSGIDLWVPTGIAFAPGGNVTVSNADLTIAGTYSSTATLNVGGDFTLSSGSFTQGGDVAITGDYTQTGGAYSDAAPTLHTFTVGGSFSVPDSGSETFNRYTGAGSPEDPYLIRDVYDLQAMKGYLSSNFRLNSNIDATSTANWNSGAGFDPVGSGSPGDPFTGALEGNSKTITGLTINRPGENYVGLLGSADGARISDVGLVNGSVSGNAFVGGLAGYARNNTAVVRSCSTGTVSGGGHTGGLIGYSNNSTVTNSYSMANVTGASATGGLVGYLVRDDDGVSSVKNSYATGNVDGYSNVGGLVGGNIDSEISNSFSTGVASASNATPGALVGAQYVSFLLTNNWWYNETNTYAIGNNPAVSGYGVDGMAEKAAAASDFHGTGSGTGGAVYTGATPWDFTTVPVWDSFAGALPRLHWENATPPPPATYTIAGLVSGLGAGISMALSFNGAAPVTTTTTGGGAFSFGSLSLSGGEYVLIYANDASCKANLVGVVQSAGDVSGLLMYDGRLSIGDADGVAGTSFTNSILGSAYYSNPNVYYSVAGGALTVNGVDLWIPSAVTFSPGGDVDLAGSLVNSGTLNAPANIYVTGDWMNSGTFNAGTGTVTFDGSASGKQITTGGLENAFYNISFTGSGGEWTLQGAMNVSGKFKVTDGSFVSGANTVTVRGANATYQEADVNAARTDWTGGTLNLQSDTDQILPNHETYHDLHLGRSSGAGTTIYTRGANFTFGNLAIDRGAAKILLTADAVGTNKVYDGLTSATVSFLDDKLSGYDEIGYSYNAVFADGKDVGTGKAVNVSGISLTGDDAIYYSLGSSTDTTTADITAKAVTLSGITAGNKVYDGGVSAEVSVTGASFGGMIAGDELTVSSNGVFDNKNVGEGKTVTLTNVLGGADLGNYTVTDQDTTTADITAKELTITGVTASNKVYDATTDATVAGTASLTGIVAGDVVSWDDSGITGTFVNKNVGIEKAVLISGLSLSGADASNYSVGSLGVTADITAKAVTLAGIAAGNKVYDGTVNAELVTGGASITGVIGGDDVSLDGSLGSGVFANKSVGNGKTVTVTDLVLSGTDASNYTVAPLAGLTADITAKELTITGVSVANKIYDGSTAVTLDTTTAALVGGIGGDEVLLDSSLASGTSAEANVGTWSVLVTGFTLSGFDKDNYTVSQPTGLSVSITSAAPPPPGPGVGDPTNSTDNTIDNTIDDETNGNGTNPPGVDDGDPAVVTIEGDGINLGGDDQGNYPDLPDDPSDGNDSRNDIRGDNVDDDILNGHFSWDNILNQDDLGEELITDVYVREGKVYVLDNGDHLQFLDWGHTYRVMYKKRKLAQAKKRAMEALSLAEAQKGMSSQLTSKQDRAEQKTASAKAEPEPMITSAEEIAVQEAKRIEKEFIRRQEAPQAATPAAPDPIPEGILYGTLKNPGRDVFVKNRGGDWIAAEDGMVLLPGDEVKTAGRDSVVLALDGGKVGKIELKGGSLFRIRKMEQDPVSNSNTTLLDLAIGKLIAKVEPLRGVSKFEVRTPTALTGVRGTVFEVEVKPKKSV